LNPINLIAQTPKWGVFALVGYIPDPLGCVLLELRQALPEEDNPQPHITVLPPRPLKLPVDAASKWAREVLRRFSAFDVELSTVSCFSGTNLLYLEVGGGSSRLHDLHNALNTGALEYAEELEFRPHLTLGGPVTAENIEEVQGQVEAAWREVACPRRFTLDEIVCLWLGPDGSPSKWRRLWSHRLRPEDVPVMRRTASTVTS